MAVKTLDCNSRGAWFKTTPFALKVNREIPRIQTRSYVKKRVAQHRGIVL